MHGFERFLLEQDGALKQLSCFLRGRYSVDELCSESWIVLCDIEALGQEPLDLSEPRGRALLLQCLKRHIARARRGSFATLSLDHGGDSDSEKPAPLRFLAAPEDSDPFVRLQGIQRADRLDHIDQVDIPGGYGVSLSVHSIRLGPREGGRLP